MLAVDFFYRNQRVIKVKGKYKGIVGIVTFGYPRYSNIKSMIKVIIVGDLGYRSDVYRYFKPMQSVRYWRPAEFLMSNRYTKGKNNE